MKGKKEDYLTLTQVRDRGWTRRLIDQFLSSPDKETPNPHNGYSWVKLFLISRVEEVEATEAWKQAKEAADKRSASARRGVATKVQDLLDEAEAVEIDIPIMSRGLLVRLACDANNSRHHTKWVSPKSEPEELNHIIVNYLRHEHILYDMLLYSNCGRIGHAAANMYFRRRVYNLIAQTYPELSDECLRQFERRHGVGSFSGYVDAES